MNRIRVGKVGPEISKPWLQRTGKLDVTLGEYLWLPSVVSLIQFEWCRLCSCRLSSRQIMHKTLAMTCKCINELGATEMDVKNGVAAITLNRARYHKRKNGFFEKLFIVSVINQWQRHFFIRFAASFGIALHLFVSVVWCSTNNWICILFCCEIILQNIFLCHSVCSLLLCTAKSYKALLVAQNSKRTELKVIEPNHSCTPIRTNTLARVRKKTHTNTPTEEKKKYTQFFGIDEFWKLNGIFKFACTCTHVTRV